MNKVNRIQLGEILNFHNKKTTGKSILITKIKLELVYVFFKSLSKTFFSRMRKSRGLLKGTERHERNCGSTEKWNGSDRPKKKVLF